MNKIFISFIFIISTLFSSNTIQSTYKNKKYNKQKKEYMTRVSNIIMNQWAKTKATKHGLSATVKIRIDNKGKLTYKDLTSSKDIDFDNKLKDTLDYFQYRKWPKYEYAQFIEAEFEFRDMNYTTKPINPITNIKQLKEILNEYKTATLNKDTDTIISNIYNKVFYIYPKALMRKQLIEMYSLERPILELTDMTYTKIGNIQRLDNRYFSVINYQQKMKIYTYMTDIKEKKRYFEYMKKEYPYDTIFKFYKNKNFFMLTMDTKLVAIKENQNNWKIIEKVDVKRLGFPKFIPNKIISQLDIRINYP